MQLNTQTFLKDKNGRLIAAHLAEVASKNEVSVTGTTTTVLAANTSRSSLIIQNVGNKKAWIEFGATAVVGEGLLLGNGDIFITDNDLMYQGVVSGIADTGSTTINVIEFDKG